jgi:hypothetical protein
MVLIYAENCSVIHEILATIPRLLLYFTDEEIKFPKGLVTLAREPGSHAHCLQNCAP